MANTRKHITGTGTWYHTRKYSGRYHIVRIYTRKKTKICITCFRQEIPTKDITTPHHLCRAQGARCENKHFRRTCHDLHTPSTFFPCSSLSFSRENCLVCVTHYLVALLWLVWYSYIPGTRSAFRTQYAYHRIGYSYLRRQISVSYLVTDELVSLQGEQSARARRAAGCRWVQKTA